MISKPPKEKKCAWCKRPFIPVRPMQRVHSLACGLALAKSNRIKAEKSEDRVKRESIKPRSQWLKEAQTAFNQYIRLRDHDLPCISCGRHHKGQYHAGHYLSVGACPELRFNENNVHKQCSACNNYLSGNIVKYRKRLIKKIGLDFVEWLEGPHEPKKYTIDDLKEKTRHYKAESKILKAEIEGK